MGQFSKYLQSSKEKLFGKPQGIPGDNPNSTLSIRERKEPYFVQIGLDFGTSYSKCICRDMMTNKAWVYIHPRSQDQELPFLIPCALIIKNNRIVHVEDTKTHYPENGLYHLKSALVLSANGQMENPLLGPYRNAVRLKKSSSSGSN